MKGEAICVGEPALCSSWGTIGGAHVQSLRGRAWEREARLTDRFPGHHSGAERLPHFLDGSAITVVEDTQRDLRR